MFAARNGGIDKKDTEVHVQRRATALQGLEHSS